MALFGAVTEEGSRGDIHACHHDEEQKERTVRGRNQAVSKQTGSFGSRLLLTKERDEVLAQSETNRE